MINITNLYTRVLFLLYIAFLFIFLISVLLIIFNIGLKHNMLEALPEMIKIQEGSLLYEDTSDNAQSKYQWFNGNNNEYLNYLRETSTFMSFLIKIIAFPSLSLFILFFIIHRYMAK